MVATDLTWESQLRSALGAVQTVVNQTVNLSGLGEQTITTTVPSDEQIIVLSPVPVPDNVQIILRAVDGKWRITAKNLVVTAVGLVLTVGRVL